MGAYERSLANYFCVLSDKKQSHGEEGEEVVGLCKVHYFLCMCICKWDNMILSERVWMAATELGVQ